jgi:hypothetical protein
MANLRIWTTSSLQYSQIPPILVQVSIIMKFSVRGMTIQTYLNNLSLNVDPTVSGTTFEP